MPTTITRTKSDYKVKFWAELFHHRWTVPVLAEFSRHRGTVGGVRSAMLVDTLGVGREALRQTLAHLDEHWGWIKRNPGYGHPLRPELILTAKGRSIADWAGLYVVTVEKNALEDVAYRKWSAAVIHAVALHEGGAARFADIRRMIPSITPRALTLILKRLSASGVMRRVVIDDSPPVVRYALTARGRRLAQVLSRRR